MTHKQNIQPYQWRWWKHHDTWTNM